MVLLHAQKISVDLIVTGIAGGISFLGEGGGGRCIRPHTFANVFTEATVYGD